MRKYWRMPAPVIYRPALKIYLIGIVRVLISAKVMRWPKVITLSYID